MTCNAGASLQLFGPKQFGAAGPSGRLDIKTFRYGTIEDIKKLGTFNEWTGKLLKIPGVPPMYDYELVPQDIAIFNSASMLEETARIYIPECDGMFSISASALDGEDMAVLNTWFDSMGHVHYAIGPLTVPKTGEYVVGREQGKEAAHVTVVKFLKEMQAKHGKKSVIYISFGSALWLINQDKFWVIVEEFLKNDIPLIVAHPAALGEVAASKEDLNQEIVLLQWN
ncbi:hypothetical protein D9758_003082 [Tetrapyrgos nigripes]|uniref:Uncharacterized protein n=1 Tax=Tetrapyrgos nigripes TaxID=182062 RepID=A0A8H5GPW4_9AGAR|nr:hypothetical protein D9758_003082 [Tetrapyrgos nigripes]